jgi:hypothetical protein
MKNTMAVVTNRADTYIANTLKVGIIVLSINGYNDKEAYNHFYQAEALVTLAS